MSKRAEKINRLITETIREMDNVIQTVGNTAPASIEQGGETAQPPASIPRKGAKATIVNFNKGLAPQDFTVSQGKREFKATYSERGFNIEGTRFSFEFVKMALSKGIAIVLNNGKGPVLDPVTLQKLVKPEYEQLY